MIKSVIFDMDGVLVDNRDVHTEAFIVFAGRYGIDFNAGEMVRFYGKGNDEIMPEILPADILDKKGLEALSDEKEAIYRDIFEATIEPATGLVDFLRDLKTHGVKMAVGSSGSKANVDFVLRKCGITDYFDVIVNGDMVTKRKPDPEIFLTAAEMLGLTSDECLVIEDSFSGITAANSARMKVVGMATTFPMDELEAKAKTDMLISDFRELDYGTIERL